MADLTIDVRFILLLIVLGAVVMAFYNRRSTDNVETPTKTETPRKCTTSRNTPATDRQSRVAGRALEALQQELVTVRQERLDLRLQLEAQAQQIAKLVEMQAAKIDTTPTTLPPSSSSARCRRSSLPSSISTLRAPSSSWGSRRWVRSAQRPSSRSARSRRSR